LKLIIDQQFPPLLAQWLRGQGCDAWHVFETGLTDRPDFEIWSLAVRDGGAVISRDSDFLNFARQKAGGRFVWMRLGNCTNPELIATFKRLWPEVAVRLEGDEQIVEVRA
jgi:predicted nuclease of predicted toxin-antitoxin system